jgi:hypothetical protein
MQLVSGGQRSGRGETHARDARAQATQGCGPVGVLPDIHRLDDQAHALLFSEVKLIHRLQDSLREDAGPWS